MFRPWAWIVDGNFSGRGLRSGPATQLALNGEDAGTIAEVLGHTDPNTSHVHYVLRCDPFSYQANHRL